MKSYILPALRITVASIVLFCIIYTGTIWAIAQLSPNKGQGFITEQNGIKQYADVGQKFTNDEYFWSRPSAVDYNATGSGGSNKGPSNADYLTVVQERIDTFMAHHPYVIKADIPSDIVTASGSGLDPHISPKAAFIQVKRIAAVRNLDESKIKALVEKHIEGPLLGMAGTSKVNVLELNLDLNNLK
ncbi:MAG: K(+)-transporting ATPase subunit C [Bacteroidetes bacterium]|nr:K(+)-transporting ATPase subunit C [Bacteroidota bacterium]